MVLRHLLLLLFVSASLSWAAVELTEESEEIIATEFIETDLLPEPEAPSSSSASQQETIEEIPLSSHTETAPSLRGILLFSLPAALLLFFAGYSAAR